MTQSQPTNTPTTAPAPLFSCTFTSCRRRGQSPITFTSWASFLTHSKRAHLTSRPILASSTSAQVGVFADALDGRNKRLCTRCAAVMGKTEPCAADAPCNGETSPVTPAPSPVWKGDVAFPALPPRITRAQAAAAQATRLSGQTPPTPPAHPPTPTHAAPPTSPATPSMPATGYAPPRQPPPSLYKPPTNLPSTLDILLTPIRACDVHSTLPGPILARAAIFSQRLLRNVYFAEAGSAAEDTAYKVWTIAYQLVFRKTLRGEKGWRTSAGRLAAMTQRLVRAERNEFGELWAEMIAAHDNRSQIEQSAASRRTSRSEGTERRRRIKRAQRLGEKALYGKAAKALAQSPTFDPAAPGMYAKMKALHPPPAACDQVAPIPPSDLSPNPHVTADTVRVALYAMDKDSATGPDRAGVR